MKNNEKYGNYAFVVPFTGVSGEWANKQLDIFRKSCNIWCYLAKFDKLPPDANEVEAKRKIIRDRIIELRSEIDELEAQL